MTKPQLQQALDDALKSRIDLLFATLCDNLTTTGAEHDAFSRFCRGLNVAIAAYDQASAEIAKLSRDG